MNRPVLLIMAAGIGSRYGGLKQLDNIGPNGELLLELSIYDAIKIGFKEVFLIIKEEIKLELQKKIGNKFEKYMNIKYIFQKNNIDGYVSGGERVKPLGTGHAVLCAKNFISSPFVVINSDDYYGYKALEKIYKYLLYNDKKNTFGVIGYKLRNTLSKHGYVSRAICNMKGEFLLSIIERRKIIEINNKIYYTENEEQFVELDEKIIVSMNIWGFMPSIFKYLEEEFENFIINDYKVNVLESEYSLPNVINKLLISNSVKVIVLETSEKWCGITYKEDKYIVKEYLEAIK